MKRMMLAGAAAALALNGAVATAGDIKVGSAAAVTGPIAELVVAIVNARNLAATHVNEQGGLHGGDTYALVLGDSQCDPKAAVDAGAKLVNVEQAVAVIGANCSGATNGMAQSVTIPAGVVMLSDTATAPSISELDDNDLVFRVAPSDAYQGRSLAELAWEHGYRKLAVTYANDDYNSGLAGVFRDRLHRARRNGHRQPGARAEQGILPRRARDARAGKRKGSRSSPTSDRAASPSCVTASRTRSSASSSGRTA